MRSRAVSSFGTRCFSDVYLSAILVSIMLPSLARARELAKRAVSASNLRGIGMGAQIYASEHDNIFPESLEVLVEQGMITREILVSPRAAGDGVSYIYFGGQKTTSNPRNVLAYELVIGEEGTNVLFIDGHVEWLRPAEFERVLQESYERRRGTDDGAGDDS